MAYFCTAVTLLSGAVIPNIGLGVYQSSPGTQTYNAVMSAIRMGYRHIDTAQFYRNEADVGRAIVDCGVQRKDIFITTKVAPPNFGFEKTTASVEKSLADLQSPYIDLVLLHAPGDPSLREESWRALEALHAKGIIKDIGVSNFGEAHLEKLLKTAQIRPSVNQIELHPWLQRRELVEYCKSLDPPIPLQAYSPLAKATRLQDPVLIEISTRLGVSPAAVLIAWSLAKGFITLPKSVDPSRQEQNLQAGELQLSPTDIALLDTLEMGQKGITGWDPITQHAV